MVGGAVDRYFRSVGQNPAGYDPAKGIGSLEEVNTASIIFICVPTPYEEASGGFDLSYVRAALDTIRGEKVVVLKSTVVPGTTALLQEQYPRLKFMYNPEFLTEMTADQDMKFPDRQIIGTTPQSFTVAADVLALLPLAPFERIVSSTTAEMIKYFGNTWFSTKVVFANQMYDLCEKLGIPYEAVREGAAADKRIGRTHLEIFHKGYRGYGGKCLPKDTRALIQLGEKHGVEMALLKKVEELNNALRAQQNLDRDR